MRRVNKLILIFAKVDRIVLYAPEISAPPVEIVIITVGGGIIPVFLDVLRVYFDTLDHYKHIRVFRKHLARCRFSHILPVVCVL